MGDGITDLTRDDARKHWAASGLTFAVLTEANLKCLHGLLDAQMRDGYLRGTFRAGKVKIAKDDKNDTAADIRCIAWYFKGSHARQCVTFERRGFIGFAGWSDDTNIQPILRAFIAWVDELRLVQTKAA